MRLRSNIAAVLLLTILPVVGACAENKSDLDVKRISRTVAYSLPLYHLNQLPFDSSISTNAYNLFIDSLDPARSYFLQSDIDAFNKEAKVLHKQLRKGSIAFAENALAILKERIDNRTAFAEKVLAEGFDTSIDETFLWDRSDAPWPKDEAEWDELWRKRLKNEYVARLVSKQVFAEEEGATETNAIDSAETNAVDSAAPLSTNTMLDANGEYDMDAANANLSPEEFILERYKQFQLTMSTFDQEMLLQRYLSAFSQV